MFNNKKILAVIPARGGSKGVPRKNIRLAGGKPLIAWIIDAAKQSRYIDRLIMSSDDEQIIQVAKQYGCEVPFVRPQELAQDDSTASDVVLHALKEVPGYDYVMLLQPTSPLTRTRDIDGCMEFCINANADSAVSVTQPDKNPYWMFHMDQDNRLTPVFGEKYLNRPRQKLPSVFIPTGAIYMAKINWFLKNRSFYSDLTLGFFIPQDFSLDIDAEKDLRIFDFLVESRYSVLSSRKS